MTSKLITDTLDELLENLKKMRRWRPYVFCGKWFIVETEKGFRNFRTKRAAVKNATGVDLWEIEL